MKYNDICIGQTFNRLYAKAHDRSAIFDHLDIADRKSTRLNSSHGYISYAVFCLKKKKLEKKRVRLSVLRMAGATPLGPSEAWCVIIDWRRAYISRARSLTLVTASSSSVGVRAVR